MIKKLELLAPAKDLECGIAAIDCGADAVYIGAPKYGARSSAGNSLDDIKKLAEYAHKFYARVYVTVNTLIYDDELDDVQKLIHDLYNVGVDAVIIQDMAVLKMDLPPIPLFASTQTNNYTEEKVKFLQDIGISRIILARELSAEQIRSIHKSTYAELEAFVHGALCVSLSGQCFLSYYSTGRSANRGECSQPCRMKYTLNDSDGRIIALDKYLLSLKDLNLSENLSELIDAGVTSFKIEGRLKDIVYVKNVTAYYRKRLDDILKNNKSIMKASSGTIQISFQPDPERTFNRGFTKYFLKGPQCGIASLNYQKSLGKPVGIVEALHQRSFTINSVEKLNNGDGICYLDKSDSLDGMNVIRAEGREVYVRDLKNLYKGAAIFRNRENGFFKEVYSNSPRRTVDVDLNISETNNGIRISAQDEDGNIAEYTFEISKEKADNQDQVLNIWRRQLKKSGAGIFNVREISIDLSHVYFLPVSALNEMRRKILIILEEERIRNYPRLKPGTKKNNVVYFSDKLNFMGNVVNCNSAGFYREHGVREVETGMEKNRNIQDPALMTCRYCIKKELNICPRDRQKNAGIKYKEPFYLKDHKNKYRLEFNCKDCFMILKPT